MGGEAYELALDRIGYWRHNEIVRAGTTSVTGALVTLEASLRKTLSAAGLISFPP